MLEHDGLGRAATDPHYSPNEMERDAQALIGELRAERNGEADNAKRDALSARIKSARILRDWARTRAGYVGR